VALAIGSEHAKKASGGKMATPLYQRVMSEYLRKTGFAFINKDDRAAVVRLLPKWKQIDAWRSSLPLTQQAKLNNPREVAKYFHEHLKRLGDPSGKDRPATRKHRQFPSLAEQLEAAWMQVELAKERAERAERESEYFGELAKEVERAAKATGKMSKTDFDRIRERVRKAHMTAPAEEPS
jgi:hypothetical protein